MTGRDLILYILSNHLEDEPIFKDGAFVGFITVEQAAAKMNVGVATVYAWMAMGRLEHVYLGSICLVPANAELIPEQNNEKEL